jgi:hypothetical protein
MIGHALGGVAALVGLAGMPWHRIRRTRVQFEERWATWCAGRLVVADLLQQMSQASDSEDQRRFVHYHEYASSRM